tara:strand:+ start:102 stop:608 length:507 start_codon:yes stop_codon:yes gene_type:complete
MLTRKYVVKLNISYKKKVRLKKMLNIKKNLTKIVLTVVSLFLIGCELEPQPVEYNFELYAESFDEDGRGFYHFKMSDGIVHNTTSRTKFVVNTNNPNIQKVLFYSGSWEYNNQSVPIINGASYTKDAKAFAWAAIPLSLIGDTVYIKAEYFDEYEWLDYSKTIGVIME